ncbi:MAG: hypothetical protein M3178_11885 [Pseudomonadota bacterium]|nr:hypothetical protein [Pseudomonadota bacterium]
MSKDDKECVGVVGALAAGGLIGGPIGFVAVFVGLAIWGWGQTKIDRLGQKIDGLEQELADQKVKSESDYHAKHTQHRWRRASVVRLFVWRLVA